MTDILPVFAMLLALAFAAYGSSAIDYLPAADDVPLRFYFGDSHAEFGSATEGIWRFFGINLAGLALNTSPGGYLAVVVLLNALNAFLLFMLLAKFQVDHHLCLGIAALLAVFPGFHEALVWVAATNFVWSSTFFLLGAWLCLASRMGINRPVLAAGLICGTTLTGNLFNEQYVFVYLALPVVAAWLETEQWLPKPTRAQLYVWSAPAASAVLYILAFLLTSTEQSSKSPGFNLRSLASSWYYQHASFQSLTVWTHAVWRKLFLEKLGTPTGLAAILLLGLGAWLFVRLMRKAPARPPTDSAPAPVWAAWILCCVAIAAVYFAAGGYSLESRKRYAFAIVGALGAVVIRPWRIHRPLGSNLTRVFVVVVIFFAITSQLLTSVRHSFLEARDELHVAINRGVVPTGTWIAGWDDGAGGIWRSLWSDFRAEFVYFHQPGSNRSPIVSDRSSAKHIGTFDWKSHEWHITPGQ